MCAAKDTSIKRKKNVVKGYLKECSVSLGLRDIDIKTAMRYNLTFIGLAIIKGKRGLEK